jgi:hypothetical protein
MKCNYELPVIKNPQNIPRVFYSIHNSISDASVRKGGPKRSGRQYYFFVITKTPFQLSGGGLSRKSMERWM